MRIMLIQDGRNTLLVDERGKALRKRAEERPRDRETEKELSSGYIRTKIQD